MQRPLSKIRVLNCKGLIGGRALGCLKNTFEGFSAYIDIRPILNLDKIRPSVETNFYKIICDNHERYPSKKAVMTELGKRTRVVTFSIRACKRCL